MASPVKTIPPVGHLLIQVFLAAFTATPITYVYAQDEVKTSGSSFGGMLWFSFVSLTLGAVLILLLAWLVKRNSEIKLPNRNTQILLQHPLGTRERVVVIKVLDRVLVLGQTSSQINLLVELDPEEIADIVPQTPVPDLTNPFAKYFKANKK